MTVTSWSCPVQFPLLCVSIDGELGMGAKGLGCAGSQWLPYDDIIVKDNSVTTLDKIMFLKDAIGFRTWRGVFKSPEAIVRRPPD